MANDGKVAKNGVLSLADIVERNDQKKAGEDQANDCESVHAACLASGRGKGKKDLSELGDCFARTQRNPDV